MISQSLFFLKSKTLALIAIMVIMVVSFAEANSSCGKFY